MRLINKIIVHCSDSDHIHHDNVESIRRWHVDENGWSDIGYHYIITKDGIVHEGRPIHKTGAHCKGQNEYSIGICLTGRHDFSDDQKDALRQVVKELCDEFGLTSAKVYSHNHFDPGRGCPNFNVQEAIA